MTIIINKLDNKIISSIKTNETEYIPLIIDIAEYLEDNSDKLKIPANKLHETLSNYVKDELNNAQYAEIDNYNSSDEVIIIDFQTDRKNKINLQQSTVNLWDYIDEIQVSDFYEQVSLDYFDEIYNSPMSISYEDLSLLYFDQELDQILETWYDDKDNMIYSLRTGSK